MKQQDPADRDYQQLLNQFRMVAIAAASILTGGAVFYHFVEKLGWLDAFYFATITLTTVGYGDITPHTNAGKFFTIFYVLAGIGILATFANLFLKRTYVKRQMKSQRQQQPDEE